MTSSGNASTGSLGASQPMISCIKVSFSSARDSGTNVYKALRRLRKVSGRSCVCESMLLLIRQIK